MLELPYGLSGGNGGIADALPDTRMKVLVTGASGFVGRALCPFLESRGHGLVQAVRRAPVGAQVQVGEVGSRTDWRPFLSGVEAVVHLAARVHVLHEGGEALPLYDEVNRWGTLNLAMQAAEAGVRRLVFLSSVKVLGEEGIFTDASLPAPRDAYGWSKWEAEKALHTVAQNTGLEVVILRPPLIHGPGVGANMARLLAWVKRGLPLPLGAVNNRRSLLGVTNLADAIHAVLTHPAAAGKTWLVSDGEAVSTAQLIRLLAEVSGSRARLMPVPPSWLRLAGNLLGRGAEVERLLGSLVVEDHGLRTALGWHPPYSLREGLALMA